VRITANSGGIDSNDAAIAPLPTGGGQIDVIGQGIRELLVGDVTWHVKDADGAIGRDGGMDVSLGDVGGSAAGVAAALLATVAVAIARGGKGGVHPNTLAAAATGGASSTGLPPPRQARGKDKVARLVRITFLDGFTTGGILRLQALRGAGNHNPRLVGLAIALGLRDPAPLEGGVAVAEPGIVEVVVEEGPDVRKAVRGDVGGVGGGASFSFTLALLDLVGISTTGTGSSCFGIGRILVLVPIRGLIIAGVVLRDIIVGGTVVTGTIGIVSLSVSVSISVLLLLLLLAAAAATGTAVDLLLPQVLAQQRPVDVPLGWVGLVAPCTSALTAAAPMVMMVVMMMTSTTTSSVRMSTATAAAASGGRRIVPRTGRRRAASPTATASSTDGAVVVSSPAAAAAAAAAAATGRARPARPAGPIPVAIPPAAVPVAASIGGSVVAPAAPAATGGAKAGPAGPAARPSVALSSPASAPRWGPALSSSSSPFVSSATAAAAGAARVEAKGIAGQVIVLGGAAALAAGGAAGAPVVVPVAGFAAKLVDGHAFYYY
jgi:hypothetical protein